MEGVGYKLFHGEKICDVWMDLSCFFIDIQLLQENIVANIIHH